MDFGNDETIVTEQWVAGEGSHERAVCVNANGLIWVIWPQHNVVHNY
jgi:hypothetical protein